LGRGAAILVETSDVIDSGNARVGTLSHVTVVGDVKGPEGKVAVPALSSGTVIILEAGKKERSSYLKLALYQLSVANRSFLLSRGSKHLAEMESVEDSVRGEGHRSVHIARGTLLEFTLSEPYQFDPEKAR
jgi:hypothetical protein